MPVTCPKCGHVRPPDASVPAYECPACGVIYAKANQAPAARPILHGDRPAKAGGGWMKWLAVAAVVGCGAVLGHRHFERQDEAQETVADREFDPDADAVPVDLLRGLAARVQAREVVMYSTTECVYCVQAKGWLSENGFAFTECNMSIAPHCLDEFRRYRANGTPFLVVRGRLMRDGFDVHQFLRILQDTD